MYAYRRLQRRSVKYLVNGVAKFVRRDQFSDASSDLIPRLEVFRQHQLKHGLESSLHHCHCRRLQHLNPLECRGNYSATLNDMKLVHWPLMGGLLQREGDLAGLEPAQAPPRCTKCNSPPINGQCTNHCIAVSVALRF